LNNLDENTIIGNGSFAGFNTANFFGQARPTPARTTRITVPGPDEVIDTFRRALYLLTDADDNPRFAPETVDEGIITEAMLLLFDAYSDEPSAHLSTLISGKIIINGNVDGTSVLYPNPVDSIVRANSRYRAGAIPVNATFAAFSETPIYLYPRVPQLLRNHSLVSFLYNATDVWLPNFRTAIAGDLPALNFARYDNVDGTIPSSNLVRTRDSNQSRDNVDPTVHLWSSYRYMTTRDRPTSRTVFMYASLEPIFGSRSSYMQTFPLPQLLPMQ
jgi:hypothetical protein